MGVAYRQDIIMTPPVLDLIRLDGFKPESFSASLLQDLRQAGFTNPLLVGGALRDDYFRQIVGQNVPTNDHDVVAGVDIHKIFGNARTTPTATQTLRDHVTATLPGSVILRANALMRNDGAFEFGGIDFTYQGQRVEIVLNNQKAELPMAQRMWSSEPLSMIAMDSAGLILADKNFPQHARERIYQPYEPDTCPEYGDPRFEKLARKIPGLQNLTVIVSPLTLTPTRQKSRWPFRIPSFKRMPDA